jgi:hypothetical protein
MTNKTMDFRIYPAWVEGKPELMNKPLEMYNVIDLPFGKVDKNLEYWCPLAEVQSGKRLIKQEIRNRIRRIEASAHKIPYTGIAPRRIHPAYKQSIGRVLELKQQLKLIDRCLRIPDEPIQNSGDEKNG